MRKQQWLPFASEIGRTLWEQLPEMGRGEIIALYSDLILKRVRPVTEPSQEGGRDEDSESRD